MHSKPPIRFSMISAMAIGALLGLASGCSGESTDAPAASAEDAELVSSTAVYLSHDPARPTQVFTKYITRAEQKAEVAAYQSLHETASGGGVTRHGNGIASTSQAAIIQDGACTGGQDVYLFSLTGYSGAQICFYNDSTTQNAGVNLANYGYYSGGHLYSWSQATHSYMAGYEGGMLWEGSDVCQNPFSAWAQNSNFTNSACAYLLEIDHG